MLTPWIAPPRITAFLDEADKWLQGQVTVALDNVLRDAKRLAASLAEWDDTNADRRKAPEEKKGGESRFFCVFFIIIILILCTIICRKVGFCL